MAARCGWSTQSRNLPQYNRQMLRALSTRACFPYLLILSLCAIAFGLLAPTLGFYWDDWPLIYMAETMTDVDGFAAAWAGVRSNIDCPETGAQASSTP